MAKASTIDVVVNGEYKDKDINRALNDLKKLQAQSMSMGGKMQAVGAQMQAMGASIAKVGKSMTVGVTLPIVGVGIAATKMAMDFDESMTKMVSLVGLTRDEVDGMRGDIVRMASQYGKSGKEAADAMFFITSAGLRGADAMETLEASLKGAAIGLGDVQTIADLATSAMNAYGPSVLSATKATSILRTAVEQGKLESTELAGAMGSVLPVASALGVGFDEAAAAMAAMSRTGTGAAEASTQLRGIMVQLTKETPKGAKALKSVGLSYEGLRQQIKEEGLLATLQTLVGAFDGNTIATSAFFGNVRALTGVMDLMGAGAETTADIFGALAATTADDLNPSLEAAAETTGFKLRQSFATLKNSLIEFGDIIAPFVQQFAERIAALGTAFQNLSPQAKQFIITAAAIAAAIGPVLLIVGKLMVAIGGIIKLAGGLVLAFNPVTLVVVAVAAAIAGLVAGVIYLWNTSETFRIAVIRLWDAIKAAVTQVIDQLKAKLNENRETVEVLRAAFAAIAQFIADKVMPIVAEFYRVYLTALIKVLGAVIGFVVDFVIQLAKFVAALVVAGKKAFDFGKVVVKAIGDAVNFVAKLPEMVKGALVGAASWLVDTGRDMIQGLLDGAKSLLGKIGSFFLDMLPGWIRGPFKAALGISSPSKEFYGYGQNIIDGLVGGLESKEGLTKSTIRKTITENFVNVRNELSGIVDQIKKDMDEMATSVSSSLMRGFNIGEAAEEIGADGARIGGTFIEKLQAQADKVTGFAQKIKDLMALGLDVNSPLMKAVIDQGATPTGIAIAQSLIDGGAATIDQAQELITAAQGAADEIGLLAATSYHGAGYALAQETLKGFVDNFGPSGKGRSRLMTLMDNLSNAMNRTATITVTTINRVVNEAVGGITPDGRRAMGGPVTAGKTYLVGEQGPELLMMGRSPGNIIPNHDLASSMTGRSGGASMAEANGTTINLTVNAGMGTSGAEVGRQIVDALKAYERRNGSVYVAA